HLIANLKPVFVPESDFSQLTKDILEQLDNSIMLVSLKEFPLQHWVVPNIDNTNQLIQHIYQHKLAVEVRGDFFTIAVYLNRLEKLSWHLYWDSLEYKVIKYPEADAILQFYVLNNEKK